MAYKEYILDTQQHIKVYKKRNNRNLRLSITAHGEVRVSIPTWAPYRSGFEFAKSRQNWIAEQIKPKNRIENNLKIGKAHRLIFIKSDVSTISTRIAAGEVRIIIPNYEDVYSEIVQEKAVSACIRALRQQSEALLPQRLAELSNKYGFKYADVKIKQLRGRWGSCDSKGNIVLNLFLMQLPWELIDYVLIHELTHTQILKHGPDFWAKMKTIDPKTRQTSKLLKTYQPILDTSQ